MEMQSVNSSNIRGIGYDADTHELHVKFNSGKKYVYSNVPETEYKGFINAGSHGSHFNRYIKGVYTFESD